MGTYARIAHIEYELPARSLDNEALARDFPEWDVDKIFQKTGINKRHIVDESETASDLAFRACEKLFHNTDIQRGDIDALIYCTQSPDYVLPATACILQHRLQLPTTCAAFDFNQGCSGYIYGLGIAKGLIESGQCRNVLLVTAETYSRYIHPQDKSVRTLFGDAAAVTLLTAAQQDGPFLERFRYGSDGAGAENLIVPIGGARRPFAKNPQPQAYGDDSGNVRTDANLYMNGPAIFEFSMTRVPQLFASLFDEEVGVPDIDLFVFHQANQFMLDALRRRLKLPAEKFAMAFQHCGNTVSCTIPIALKESVNKGALKQGDLVAAVGFGVGYSWGACLIRW
ncbi:ketoacyl-ACP synthase III [Pseudomonas cichorii]|nr:ketoacyl-ACP synthase III [Pseudomonas cichorii]MBX8533755.1 ketoacyl-ACP synthase III [Pseudomonas cichorii]MBX8567980.1 ketoacyl-ACP synthase III [Pseudomonas cichorii]MBX8598608.1 ketoacyl-ACP synthase III [Pseudomonas cichorii]MBX8604339.1 ketoacyl-ACP synthase III [Pseudomonas cichorii]